MADSTSQEYLDFYGRMSGSLPMARTMVLTIQLLYKRSCGEVSMRTDAASLKQKILTSGWQAAVGYAGQPIHPISESIQSDDPSHWDKHNRSG